MEPEEGEIKLIDQGEPQVLLRRAEKRARTVLSDEGLEPMQGQDTGFHIDTIPGEIEVDEDVFDIIDGSQGLREARVSVYWREGDNTGQLSEGLNAEIDFPVEKLVGAYEVLSEDYEVSKASVNVAGYGQDVFEAFNNAYPMVTYFLGSEGERGEVVVSPRGGGTLETMRIDDNTMSEIYDSFTNEGFKYDGTAMIDQKEDGSYVFSDNPAELSEWE